MELVEGDELCGHIARGPIQLADALRIAKQIAEALEAAHEQGIVHRESAAPRGPRGSDLVSCISVLSMGHSADSDPRLRSIASPLT